MLTKCYQRNCFPSDDFELLVLDVKSQLVHSEYERERQDKKVEKGNTPIPVSVPCVLLTGGF